MTTIRLSSFLTSTIALASWDHIVILRTVVKRLFTTGVSNTSSSHSTKPRKQFVFDNRITLHDFLLKQSNSNTNTLDHVDTTVDVIPYLAKTNGNKRKFYIEVYGCQMNTNDTEILNAILHNAGFQRTSTLDDSDIIFLMTCAIRDNAEQKIWNRLAQLKSIRTKHGISPQIGVLGCMAERLRNKLLDQDKLVDVVCGPDAYRSLPTLLAMANDTHQVANVMLSADETYADIMPLRLDSDKISAHLSIMRGCNNHCSFCIVPFTRGIERSRPIESIVNEVRRLSEQGIREVTLLGQNVNSYRDTSNDGLAQATGRGSTLAPGFSTIYKRKEGGLRFAELIHQVALVNPEMRIRFTSPHPKDFPDDLLHVIKSHSNICNHIHMPAQSGSTTMLQRMRRGYTREAYIALVDQIRKIIPGVSLSTDIITGFCDETEQEHQDTVSLMRELKFDQAYMFAYSMREKTHAHRNYQDNVPVDIKQRRLQEVIQAHYDTVKSIHRHEYIGTDQLVLVEGLSRRSKSVSSSDPDNNELVQWMGRADNNIRVHFLLPKGRELKGQYVRVRITSASGASLTGNFTGITTIRDFFGQPIKSLPHQ